MITHNPTFETLAKAPVKQTDVIVIKQIISPTGYVDSTPTWTSSTTLMSVTIDALGEMLGTTTKKAKVQLLGIASGVKAGDVFNIRFGIYGTSAFNYVSQGLFVVDTVDYNYDSGSTTITLYDAMWRASAMLYSETVVGGAITYPITVNNFALYIASLLGVDLNSGFSSLPNASYPILADLYVLTTGATIQNVIQDIAGATGTTARMTDNTLNFSQFSMDSENLDSSTLKTLKIGDTYGPVTSVVLGRLPQNDNIAIYATTPEPNIVTAVDATLNTLTINTHNMLVGNLVQFASTGTLPAPLTANTSYYVSTTTANTFKLALTYSTAVAGTGLVDLTTTGTGTITIVALTTKEIQINNNQILDDDRQTLVPALYNKLSGIYWTDVKADTIGLGWHEVGDVIQFTQGAVTVRAFLSEVHLTLAGSVKESLVSRVPNVAAINYQTAGGILKSIYNTEIKVDKQNQAIVSVVSRQDTFEGTTLNNFTAVNQNINDITLTVQKSGSGNLLLNSVGFAKTSATDINSTTYDQLSSWTYPTSYATINQGIVTSSDSSESQGYGGISGRLIQMSSDWATGKTMTLVQRINVAVNTPLSFGVRVKNALGTGTASITIANTNDTHSVSVNSTTAYVWDELKIENFVSTMSWLDVTITASAAAFKFSDLRIIYGNTLLGWVQSNSEILSTNVQFTVDGMRIFDTSHNTETRVTYNEFSTRRKADGVILFEANDTGVTTNDISIKGATSYKVGTTTVIKQITIPPASALAGIAFVKG